MTLRVTAVRCDDLSSGYYIEEDEAPGANIWQRLSRLLKVLLLLAMVAMTICAFQPELSDQRMEREKLSKLREQINGQKRIHSNYERQVNWLTNSPEYLETFARDRFDLMKEGETIFRLDEGKSKAALAPVLPTMPKRLN